MMPDLVPRITTAWLDPAVPVSLSDMGDFQDVTDTVRNFCDTLGKSQYTGFSDLQEWVENSPRVWLSKCRETALDSVRSKLSQGLGSPREVERVETQTVSKSEGIELVATTPAATTTGEDGDDWGAAWEDEAPVAQADSKAAPSTEEDDGTDAWGWGEGDDGITDDKPKTTSTEKPTTDDDGGDAWGWGDEEITAGSAKEPTTAAENTQKRELTMREIYNISAMPAPVLALISTIVEDGAALAR